uniref:U2 snRNP-associated SURP motif-containing protein n=1 Tax=Peronospora matthiolae TaxID=2874970 RepID=A0AAV1UXU8_9STRA
MGRNRVEDEADALLPAVAPQSQLPWGMEKTEMQPSSLTSLTDDKLARFVLGHQKKTKFQKEREDRETRKRQAEEEAAKIYATFVASFDNDDETQGKTFVRSTAALDNQQQTQERGEMYRLKAKEVTTGSISGFAGGIEQLKVSETDTMRLKLKQKETEKVQQSEKDLPMQKHKKRRAIDEFLEEMKERGPAPVSLEGSGLAKGSFDDGNPETTNLYVGNLAPSVTEEVLEAEFEQYGEVHSVKIMWPRSEEERARKRNCGFVSFYERRDADDARVNLDNKELEGQPMIVGWGKAVAIQPRKRAVEVPLPPVVAFQSATAAKVESTAKQELPVKQTITVEVPTEEIRRRVDRLARYVATDGLQFENAVRMREANNKDYAFLFDPQCATALYYRWRVYSFAMGDGEKSWRETAFQMTADAPFWVPPKMPPRARRSRSRGSTSRSSGRSRHDKSTRSYRRNLSKSRSYSRSRSRSFSPSPRRPRQKSQKGSRRRSSSFSSDEDRDYRRSRSRRRSGRSRGRGRRSRSWSSDNSSLRKRSRRSRSRPRQNDKLQNDKRDERSRRNRRDDGSRGQEGDCVAKNKELLTGQQIARARDVARGRERDKLSNEDYDEFKKMLDGLTLERESVKQAMGFALDKSEAAVDLVSIMIESFKSSSSNGVALVGLLYVTSDILHNSSAAVKNASLFRTTFEECLPDIMQKLRCVHKNIGGRMSANAMKEKVMDVLSAWESWSLFPPAVLLGLHATFLRKTEEDEYLAVSNIRIDGIVEADLGRLRKTCRQSGVLSTGDAKQLVARLQWLKEFTTPTTLSGSGQAVAKNKPSAQLSHGVGTSGVATSHAGAVIAGKVKKEDTLAVDSEDKPNDEVTVGESLADGGKTGDGNDDIYGETMDEEELDGEPFDEDADEGKLADEEDLDGEPLNEDADEGEASCEDADGSELDGEPLDGDDLDGVPIDDELDGKPF